MKYYLLSNSAIDKEIGEYPQTKGFVSGYNEDAKNSMTNLTSDELPAFIPDLRFELEEKAILTDVISPSNMDFAVGFLMSEKTRDILSIFRIINHVFFSATVKANRNNYDYHWLHLVNPGFTDIDFTKSTFIEILPGQIYRQVTFSSESDFENYYPKTNYPIKLEKLALTDTAQKQELDLFFFPFLHRGIIVSERLCSAILKNKITGLIINEQTFLS